jgi:hypothetical protein
VIIERFTLADANTLDYRMTVNDPKSFVAPWTMRMPIPREDDYGFFEYGCHEGNYAMFNLLSGSRAEEKRRARSGGSRRSGSGGCAGWRRSRGRWVAVDAAAVAGAASSRNEKLPTSKFQLQNGLRLGVGVDPPSRNRSGEARRSLGVGGGWEFLQDHKPRRQLVRRHVRLFEPGAASDLFPQSADIVIRRSAHSTPVTEAGETATPLTTAHPVAGVDHQIPDLPGCLVNDEIIDVTDRPVRGPDVNP